MFAAGQTSGKWVVGMSKAVFAYQVSFNGASGLHQEGTVIPWGRSPASTPRQHFLWVF
jgi:hypothetical protein